MYSRVHGRLNLAYGGFNCAWLVTEAQSIQYVVESRSLGCVWYPTQTQEWRQYLNSVAKSPYLPQCLSSAADLRLENLGKSYSAPGGPHLKYDPESNTKAEGQRIGRLLLMLDLTGSVTRDHTLVFHWENPPKPHLVDQTRHCMPAELCRDDKKHNAD